MGGGHSSQNYCSKKLHLPYIRQLYRNKFSIVYSFEQYITKGLALGIKSVLVLYLSSYFSPAMDPTCIQMYITSQNFSEHQFYTFLLKMMQFNLSWYFKSIEQITEVRKQIMESI